MSAGPHGGWKSVELREVGKIVTGSTPPKARQDYYGGNFPFVKPGELLNCPVSDSVDKLSDAGSEVADVAPAGGILVSCIGNLGKIGLATRPVAFNQQINAIIPNVPVHSKWVFYAVQTSDFASQIAAVSSATTIAIVNKGKFSTLRIPLAPVNEQRRIVAEIEKQFTRLEAGVEALRRVHANLKRYRAAVLKAACEGRLVQTEAELAKTGNRKAKFETGEALLARILAERRQNWKGRGQYREPAAPDTANLPSLPEGWRWASVEQLGRIETGSTPPKAEAANYGDEVPLVKPGELLDHPVAEAADNLTRKGAAVATTAPPNSVLVSCIGNLGKTALTVREVAFNQQINAIIPTLNATARWIFYTVQQGAFRQQLESVASATTISIVNKSKFSGLILPLPPLAEQVRIVAEVERRLSVVEEMEAVVSTNLQRATRLRQSVLQKAFTGRL